EYPRADHSCAPSSPRPAQAASAPRVAFPLQDPLGICMEAAVMRPDSIEITVLREGECNRLLVTRGGAPVVQSDTRVDDGFLRDLVAEVGVLAAEAPEGVGIAARLARFGRVLHRQLVPAPVAAILEQTRDATLTLVLDPALRDVPWELC